MQKCLQGVLLKVPLENYSLSWESMFAMGCKPELLDTIISWLFRSITKQNTRADWQVQQPLMIPKAHASLR